MNTLVQYLFSVRDAIRGASMQAYRDKLDSTKEEEKKELAEIMKKLEEMGHTTNELLTSRKGKKSKKSK